VLTLPLRVNTAISIAVVRLSTAIVETVSIFLFNVTFFIVVAIHLRKTKKENSNYQFLVCGSSNNNEITDLKNDFYYYKTFGGALLYYVAQYFIGMEQMIDNLPNYRVNDALNQIIQADYGAHYIMIYPDLSTQRELYSGYIQKQIEENNEIMLINPFYETTESVRQILSKNGVNVSKYEKEKEVVIIDSLQEYFGAQPDMLFKRNLVNFAKQNGKRGLSIIGDIGAYTHKSQYKNLVDYELSLPIKFDVDMKGFCMYHQGDFNKFSDKQKQELIKHHGKALTIER
jgi:hypothetical protein